MKSTLKGFFRFVKKNKLYSFVTVFGFSIAITFVLFLSAFLLNELSVDDFHDNVNRIYRIEHEGTEFSAPIADDLKNNIPEIEDFTRVYNESAILFNKKDEKIAVNYLAVDSTFFDIFTFPKISGSIHLNRPNDIVLTEALAKRLFPNEEPLNKLVVLNEKYKFYVSGIIKGFPENTHFKKTDVFLNIASMEDVLGMEDFLNNYGFCSLSIYLLEKRNADLSSKSEDILKYFNENFWIYKEGYASKVDFTPLRNIYFSDKEGNWTKNSSKLTIVVVGIIVLLILLLSVGNYINLTYALSTFRGKEVAIRKMVGSTRKRLLMQFLIESLIFCLIATFLALIFVLILKSFVERNLGVNLDVLQNFSLKNIGTFLSIILLVSLTSGFIPAIKITSFKPIQVVKGELRTKSKSIYTKIFIIFQFTLSIALLASSWIIINQTNFLKSKDLGYNPEDIIWIEYMADTRDKGLLKSEFLRIPGVKSVSMVWGSPIDGGSNQSFTHNGKPISMQEIAVDSSFFNLFEIKKRASNNVSYSPDGVYLNNPAINSLGIDETATSFKKEEIEIPILGIVDDFNFDPLQKNIRPLMIRQQNESFYVNKIFIKLENTKSNLNGILQKIKEVYRPKVDNAPIEINFVNSTISNWYIKEERLSKIIAYFATLSLLISSLGILALSTFFLRQRRKEISIRKVIGSSISEVILLLNKDYVKWVFIALMVATPISWSLMKNWLQNFAYQTNIEISIYLISGILTLLMAVLSVSWQTYKAAKTNPVENLKDE